MEELDNKTVMCSVFFLDIVGYSKKSVTGQISLKDRFNTYLSAAIRDVPITDRIILDTGDGAAINFLGDVEDALKAALSLRESLLNEDPNLNHPLLVRMGINLGPVRLVRDINGQPNIVGDGINVAQRVMGFADASQVLVSRSYFDAVSRLSPQYADMFHYQGSRTDKHVREHEVYAIGYPDDKDSPRLSKRSKKAISRAMDGTRTSLRPAVLVMKFLSTNLMQGFSRAGPAKRIAYAVIFLVVLLVMLEITEEKMIGSGTPNVILSSREKAITLPQSNPIPTSTISPIVAASGAKPELMHVVKSDSELSSLAVNEVPVKKLEGVTKKKLKDIPQHLESEHKISVTETPEKKEEAVTTGTSSVESTAIIEDPPAEKRDTNILVTCLEGSEVFIDGARKGKVGASSLLLPVLPGRHLVIVSHTKGMDWKIIKFKMGATVSVNPDFCNHG